MTSKPKILLIHDRSGCAFWRAWQPALAMQRQGLADVRFLEARFMKANDIADSLKWCDLVSFMGLQDTYGLSLARQYQSLGKPVVSDYDDLHFNVSPWNPAYKHFGSEEVRIKDPKTGDIKDLWVDGKNGFDIKRNNIKFHAYKALLQELSLITTPSMYLKEAMTEISGMGENIRVIPNAIDFTQWKPLDIRDKYKDKFRFGWAVSNSHGEDWLAIKPVITEFLKRHSDAKFVVIGDTSFNLKEAMGDLAGQIEWYPFSDLWEYHYSLRMPMLGLDVAIAPLAQTEFNKCKSPLKYAEYTAFGWPVIAQKMTPYLEHIVHGETGLLASSPTDWVGALEALYDNKSQRAKLHFNAMRACKDMFDLEKVAHEWADVYKDLIGAKTNV